MFLNCLFKSTVLYVAIAWLVAAVDLSALAQEVQRTDKGLYELVDKRLRLVTDIPIDAELKSWPGLLDQAIEHWRIYFDADPDKWNDLHLDVMLVGDRAKMESLGMLDAVPAFEEGYQLGNQLYVREQSSVYFRRNMFLHEATHWIVWHLYGGGGSPWFMEGLAEMQGTHSLVEGKLTLGLIPEKASLVPAWGRLRLIHDTLSGGVAPSLDEIFAYGNAREEHRIRYAWSWAACQFFSRHPKYGPILNGLYRQGLDYSYDLSARFKKCLLPEWPIVQAEWNAFVSDLDFGYDFHRSLVRIDQDTRVSAMPWMLQVDRGWQSTGIRVEAGQSIGVEASGKYRVREGRSVLAVDWDSEPAGITAEYHRGKPLGCLLASLVSLNGQEQTRVWEEHRVGRQSTWAAKSSGMLFLKVNEPSRELHDNVGELSVRISVNQVGGIIP